MSLSASTTRPLGHGASAIRPPGFVQLLALSFRAHGVFFLLIALYMTCDLLLLQAYGIEERTRFGRFAWMFVTSVLPIFLLAVVTFRFARLAMVERPEQPLLALLKDLKAFFSAPRRLANGIPAVLVMFLFMRSFGTLKANIPNFNAFSWDVAFAELDRALHFGMHPYELLQPVLGYAPVTFAINFVYNLWFMIMWMIWMWLAFASRHSRVRMQFFLSFLLCWAIAGTALAIVFSSAGPCYYGFVVPGPDPFAPLMDYLARVNESLPIWALETQALLWQGYTGEQSVVVGISAMPSMHNATAVLFALVGWRTGRSMGIALTAFALFILIGSVHLGWHYAVDGYIGALIAVAVWWCAGRFVDWYEGNAPVAGYVAAMNRD